jgi:hypothetical protein
MAFSLPTFNLAVNVWNDPNFPPFPPSFSTVGNLAYGRRVNAGLAGNTGPGGTAITLLLPAGTDVRSQVQGLTAVSVVEVPAFSHRYYQVRQVDDAGKGFPNEHRVAVLLQTNDYGDWPIPMP